VKGKPEGALAPSETIIPLPLIRGGLKGLRPFIYNSSPSPLKERGIKGVR